MGTIQDLSGPLAGYGKAVRNGIQLRFDELNEQGNIHGRKLKLITEDSGYDPKRAVLAAQKLVNQDKIFIMAGHIGTAQNNAAMPVQFEKNIINFLPVTAAREMYEPFNRLKFYAAASYVDQVRAGINYLVKEKGKKNVCVMYQDTDFGKEILEGAKEQTEKLKIKIVETATHKPTDQDFTASLTKLKAANCDLIVMGTIVRDTIIPYTAARKSGWTDVTFLGSSATYDAAVGAAPGMDGFYGMGLTDMLYADSDLPAVRKFYADYKAKFGKDPNVGAIYGYVGADLTVQGLKNAGKDLTLDSFIKGMEAIKDSKDLFGGPPATFGPNIRQGANASFVAEVKNGKWVRLTPALGF